MCTCRGHASFSSSYFMASNKCFSIFIAVFHSLTLWIVSWVAHLAPLLLFVVFFWYLFWYFLVLLVSFLLHHRIEAQTRLCWLIEPQLQPCLLLWLLASSISLSISPSISHSIFPFRLLLILLINHALTLPAVGSVFGGGKK